MLADEDSAVLGRFNLYAIGDGTAELGYRVAQQVAGRGVATAAVRELCLLANQRRLLQMRVVWSRQQVLPFLAASF